MSARHPTVCRRCGTLVTPADAAFDPAPPDPLLVSVVHAACAGAIRREQLAGGPAVAELVAVCREALAFLEQPVELELPDRLGVSLPLRRLLMLKGLPNATALCGRLDAAVRKYGPQ